MRLLGEALSDAPDAPTPPLWAPRSSPVAGSSDGAGKDFEPGPTVASGDALAGWPTALASIASELVGLVPAIGRRWLAMMSEVDLQPPLAPRSILNVPITGSRRYAAEGWPLERIRAVARAVDGTVNDVVLAMCSSALRSYLGELNCLPDAPLVAMAPVSLERRHGTDRSEGGNAVGAILCDLATEVPDPLERLGRIQASMRRGKEALAGLTPLQAAVFGAAQLAPLAACALPGLAAVVPPPFNLIISNVPGPRRTLYLDGARLVGLYPLSVPLHGQALNVTAASYDGSLDFGLTGDRRALPHLQRLLVHLGAGLSELEASAGS
ncbi:MAG: WS/DGAT domain-containing protein, partial [Actinomycetota bacterium]|nr:WS/DGAT domain-containing protein [Actinomycetota bacterium]